MRTNTRIPLGKKDISIYEWWNSAISMGVNVSNVIVMCLEYYRITGKFLHIADINIENVDKEPRIKTAYIPETTNVYKWLEERQKQGDKVSRVIKYVLRNSIATQQVSKTVLVSQDFLFSELEKLKYEPKEIGTQRISEMETEKTQLPAPHEEEKTIEQEYIEVEEPETFNERTEVGGTDIFAALIGNNGLHL